MEHTPEVAESARGAWVRTAFQVFFSIFLELLGSRQSAVSHLLGPAHRAGILGHSGEISVQEEPRASGWLETHRAPQARLEGPSTKAESELERDFQSL